jgi:hypothetical protein
MQDEGTMDITDNQVICESLFQIEARLSAGLRTPVPEGARAGSVGSRRQHLQSGRAVESRQNRATTAVLRDSEERLAVESR